MRWGSLTGILLLNVLLKQLLPGSSYVKCIMLIQAYLALLRFTDVAGFFFFKLKARPSTTKRLRLALTRFTAILALLQWSGTEPAISPRYACTVLRQ